MMAAGRFADAIPLYRELVHGMPGNPGPVLNLAIAQHMAAQDREALANFAVVLKANPAVLPALILSGASHLRLGQPAKAIPFLEKAAGMQPDDAEVQQMLADALLMTERFKQAAAQFRKLAARMPRNPKVWFGLGHSYESLAQQAFNAIPVGSRYWFALVGETRLKERRFTAAFAAYKQAGNLPGVHRGLAEIYRETGHPEWAAQEKTLERKLDCAAPLSPACAYESGNYLQAANAPANSPEGQYWRTRGYNQLALDAFSRISQLPESVELHQVLAAIARGQNRHKDALGEWQKALQLAPGDPQVERELAISYYLSGDYPEAETRLRSALQKAASPDLNFYLGDTLLNLQRPADALAYLEQAGSSPAVHAVMGRTLMQLNRPADALPHIQAALAIDNDGSLHYQLARAYQATGHPDLAKQAMAKYQELNRPREEAEGSITAPEPSAPGQPSRP